MGLLSFFGSDSHFTHACVLLQIIFSVVEVVFSLEEPEQSQGWKEKVIACQMG